MIGPKSKKYKSVELPSFVNDLGSLIAFIQDKKAISDHYEKLNNLIKEVNFGIEKLGKVEDIDRIYSEAELREQTAKEALEDAKEKADQVILDATLEATMLVSEAKEESDSLLGTAKARELETLAAHNAVTQRENAVKAQESRLKALEQDLQAREHELAERAAEVERKRSILSQL